MPTKTKPKTRVPVKRAVMGPSRPRAAQMQGASRSISRIGNFEPDGTDSNYMLSADGDVVRGRARKLHQENPWASGALDAFDTKAIGSGIRPSSMHPRREMRRLIDETFEEWTEQADPMGQTDWYGMQSVICRAQKSDGEVFVRSRLRRPSDGILGNIQYQVLEADHLPLMDNRVLTGGRKVKMGIELDAIGRKVGYWMLREHPGSLLKTDSEKVFVTGEEIHHVFDQYRPGQLRGFPWLTPAIVMLWDAKQLLDASLLREKIANLLSIWIEKAGAGGILGETEEIDEKTQATKVISELGPGGVQYLQAGEKVQFLTPNNPGQLFGDHLNSILRALARSLNIPFEVLSGDLGDANFSRSRMSLVDWQRAVLKYIWKVMIFQHCRKVWKQVIFQLVNTGALGKPAIAEYAADPRTFSKVVWQPEGWDWIQPEVDIKAANESVRSGFTTRSAIVRAKGENPELVDEENAADNKRADDLQVKYDSDGRNDKSQPNNPNQNAPNEAKPPAATKKAKAKK